MPSVCIILCMQMSVLCVSPLLSYLFRSSDRLVDLSWSCGTGPLPFVSSGWYPFCWRIQVSWHWFHTPSAAKNVMLSCSHACIVPFLVSAETFMFIKMRNSIMRSVSLFYFSPSSPFLWINSSIWCVVQLNRCLCYHRELSGWVEGGNRVGITCLRVGNCATSSFGGSV